MEICLWDSAGAFFEAFQQPSDIGFIVYQTKP